LVQGLSKFKTCEFLKKGSSLEKEKFLPVPFFPEKSGFLVEKKVLENLLFFY